MKYENKLLKVTNVLLKTTFFSFKYPVDNMLFEMSYRMLCSPIWFAFFGLHLRVVFFLKQTCYLTVNMVLVLFISHRALARERDYEMQRACLFVCVSVPCRFLQNSYRYRFFVN